MDDQALLENNPQFKAFAEAVDYAIIIGNSDGNIIDFNDAALKMFGYTAEELRGQPLTILMPERYKGAHSAGLSRFKKTGEKKIIGSTVKVFAQHKDGSEFPIGIALSSWTVGGKRYFNGSIRAFSAIESNFSKIIYGVAAAVGLMTTVIVSLFLVYL